MEEIISKRKTDQQATFGSNESVLINVARIALQLLIIESSTRSQALLSALLPSLG